MNDNIELLKRAKLNDEEAIEKLIENNIGLVRKVAQRFANRKIEFEDAVQIGNIGLMKAIEKFDFSYNVQFSTYAVPMIMGEIRRFLRDDGIIKVSRSIKENYRKINCFLEEYRQKNNCEPTVSQIATALSIDVEDVVTAISYNPVCESLNANIFDENKTLEETVFKDENQEEKIVDKLTLYQALENLTEREKTIISERYFSDKTQSDVAKQLSISQVQVSRLEKKILLELKNKLICSWQNWNIKV